MRSMTFILTAISCEAGEVSREVWPVAHSLADCATIVARHCGQTINADILAGLARGEGCATIPVLDDPSRAVIVAPA